MPTLAAYGSLAVGTSGRRSPLELLMRIKETFALTSKLRELRDFSYVTFAVERLFLVLQQLSPATWFLGSRRRAHDRVSSDAQWQQLTQVRGKQIEVYVLVWAVLLALSVWLAPSARDWMGVTATVLAGWRAFDVIQTGINVALFDHFRVEKPHSVSGYTRSVVLGLYNYLELMVCFGIIYSVHPAWMSPHGEGAQPYYFSAITQLTIGYGDVQPLGPGRTLAIAQGLAGLLFLVIVLARFVTLMPHIKSVQRGDRK